MKKILLLVLLVLCLSGCQDKEVSDQSPDLTLQDGIYVQVLKNQEGLPARIWVEGGKMSFSYDMLSSYLPYGTYSQKGRVITLVTDDKKYTYRFELTPEGLIFLADQSSRTSVIDRRLTATLEDGSLFVKEE